MQFQCDILNIPLVRPMISETTALGVAYLAGLAIGYWNDLEEISNQWIIGKKFEPKMHNTDIEKLLNNWQQSVIRSKGWLQ